MTNLIVFEGNDEVIITSAAKVNEAIKLWFLEGGRSLDDYEWYLVDADEGFSITTKLSLEYTADEFDVTELMPHELRESLIAANLLTEGLK